MRGLEQLVWIGSSGVAMALIALVGAITLLFPAKVLSRWVKPLVSLAAGSLIGGAVFHMLPRALAESTDPLAPFAWLAVGFTIFLALDQLLEWHQCRRAPSAGAAPPVTWMLLGADGLHNFLGGLAVGAAFLVDIRLGITAWVAAALHEVPQELGDFSVFVEGGMSHRRALTLNLLSALTFPVGGVLAWAGGQRFDVSSLLAVGAGSFLYIAAADLVPLVKRSPDLRQAALRLLLYLAGLLPLYATSALL